MKGTLKKFSPLEAPYINVKSKVIMPGLTNGVPNVKYKNEYAISPSAKKIGTYIVNQIFGSDLVTQTEGLDIGWLMPTLKEALEQCVYDREAFIYLHKYDNKCYLEVIKKCNITNLVQAYDMIKSCTIVQEFDELNDKSDYMLERNIEITKEGSVIKFQAYEKAKKTEEWIKMPINKFNKIANTEYLNAYNLPYQVIINIDIGEDFFKDSKRLLNEEMNIIDTIASEIEKTKTRIVTTEHYQTTDISNSWRPGSTAYNIRSLNVGNIADYFTLLPGDKEHQMFEFLQGDIRIEQYQEAFKFYDYQIIQMAGLSPSTFGYEKDSYMNTTNVELSANASEMTIEAIKTQIESQIDNLIENIIKLQISTGIDENLLPTEFSWNYGSNERFDDMKKLKVLSAVQRTTAVPYSTRVKIIQPILNKLIDEEIDDNELSELLEEYKNEKIEVDYGEI